MVPISVSSANTNARKIASVPSQPAVRPGIHRCPSPIRTVPSSGQSSTSQAKVVTWAATVLPVEFGELVDVDREATAVDRDDQPQPDGDLGGRDDHHDQRED